MYMYICIYKYMYQYICICIYIYIHILCMCASSMLLAPSAMLDILVRKNRYIVPQLRHFST